MGALVNTGDMFQLSEWRDSIEARRAAIRTIVSRVIVGDEKLDPVLAEFKRAVKWYRMADKDKNALNVMFHDIRSIVWNWHLIPQEDREAFLAGKVVPSTMAKQARALAP